MSEVNKTSRLKGGFPSALPQLSCLLEDGIQSVEEPFCKWQLLGEFPVIKLSLEATLTRPMSDIFPNFCDTYLRRTMLHFPISHQKQ
jgi:hypothetical protein